MDAAEALNETVAASSSRVTELAAQVSALTATRDVLEIKNEEAATKLSELQSACEETPADFMGEAEYKCTIANLTEKVKQHMDAAAALKETVAASCFRATKLAAQVSALTVERDALETKSVEAAAELSELHSNCEKMRVERDAAEAKVQELLCGNSNTEEIMTALNSEKEVLVAKIEECIARLYEKDSDEDIEKSHRANFDMNSSSSPLQKLEGRLQKLSRDKQKLEAYTKQTLHIFQQKYFTTTQEYKARLKEKTAKIKALETELENILEDGEVQE